MLKLQNSLETLILISLGLIVFIAVFSLFFGVFNKSGITYSTSPYELNNLNFFNFASQQSTCSFDFSYSLNKYESGNQSDLYFILNNGVKIIPEYGDYSLHVSEATTGLYSYTYSQTSQTSYNSSVCTSMAQSLKYGYYVKYVERKISDGKFIVQPTSSDLIFDVNSKNTNPETLYDNNTVYLSASFITDSGIVSVKNQNGTKFTNSPFAFGEYLYLPTGNYTISYSNESNPVNFMYWNYSGGIILSNPFSSTTDITVLNNGEIFANLRSLFAVEKYFTIYSNESETLEGTKLKISVAPPVENGFYTFYVNNQPYSSCTHITSGSCVISESAGNYTISANFENSTKYEVSYPISVDFYVNYYLTMLSSNNTMGSVSPSSGSYKSGSFVSISAKPNPGYVFLSWTGSGKGSYSGTEESVDIPINGSITEEANFAQNIIYVPITINNNQNSATPAPFQEMIVLNSSKYSQYEQSGLQNIEFTTGPYGSGTPLQAWIETNPNNSSTSTIIWVKLPNGISADGSTTIYLNFMKNGVISSSGPTGEAPKLSSSYAEYDNGANVFDGYWNFAGSALPSGFTALPPTGNASYSVNNGLVLHGTSVASSNSSGIIIQSPDFTAPYGLLVMNLSENYGDVYGCHYNGFYVNSGPNLFSIGDDNYHPDVYSLSASVVGSTQYSGSTVAYNISSIYLIGSSYQAENTSIVTQIGSNPTVPSPLVSSSSSSLSSTNIRIQATANWCSGSESAPTTSVGVIGTFAYPPNGVMPTATFGSIQ